MGSPRPDGRPRYFPDRPTQQHHWSPRVPPRAGRHRPRHPGPASPTADSPSVRSDRTPPNSRKGDTAVRLKAPEFDTRPFLKIRKAYLDVLPAGRRKNMIHGLVEIDVTDAHRILRGRESAGEDLSFTAFLIHAVARAVDADRIMHAYRRHNRLILFRDVDVNTMVETEEAGQKIIASLLIRAANRKTVHEISQEIRQAQHADPAAQRRYTGMMAVLTLPKPVRSLLWRAVMANPMWVKRFGGTVGLSAVGMFAAGGGWGIPIAPPTLMITVGGIATKPRYLEGDLHP